MDFDSIFTIPQLILFYTIISNFIKKQKTKNILIFCFIGIFILDLFIENINKISVSKDIKYLIKEGFYKFKSEQDEIRIKEEWHKLFIKTNNNILGIIFIDNLNNFKINENTQYFILKKSLYKLYVFYKKGNLEKFLKDNNITTKYNKKIFLKQYNLEYDIINNNNAYWIMSKKKLFSNDKLIMFWNITKYNIFIKCFKSINEFKNYDNGFYYNIFNIK